MSQMHTCMHVYKSSRNCAETDTLRHNILYYIAPKHNIQRICIFVHVYYSIYSLLQYKLTHGNVTYT